MDSSSRSLVPVSAGNQLNPAPLSRVPTQWDDEAPPANRWRSMIARYEGGIIVLLLLCIAVGLVTALLTAPVYRAQAQVEFQQQADRAQQQAKSSTSSAPFEAQQFQQTQLGIIHSRALAEKVADSLNLPANKRILNAITPAQPVGGGNSKADVVELLQGGVGTDVTENSRLATLWFDSSDPTVSAAIANSYVDNYIQINLQRQYDTSVYSRQFLQTRLGQSKTQLENSERALIDYTRSAKLIDPSAGTSSVSGESAPHSLNSENLMQMNQSLSTVRAERIAAEQRWREAQQTPAMSLPEVLANPTIQQLTQKSAEAQAAYQQERQRRQDEHPALVQAAAQITEINKQIDAIAQSVRNSIRERYEVARNQEAALTGSVGKLQGETLADQGKGVKYNVLKRDADTNRQLYDGLLQRLNELSVAAGVNSTNISIVDRAEAPAKPILPKPALSAAVGGMIGLALSMLYVIGCMIVDDSVHSPDQLHSKLRLPLLGVLPRVKVPVDALEDPGSPLSEAHYSLRGSLEQSSSRANLRTMLFTSSGEGEGKTTAAYGVARDFANSGKRVLLIDADMRKPSVHQYFNVYSTLGLSTVLAGQSTTAEAMIETAVPGLTIMPSGPIPTSAAALLSGKQFADMLKEAGKAFDIVVIDGPPVLGLADTPRLAAVARSTVFIVEANRAQIANVGAALRRLSHANANVIGAVLTKFDVRRSTGAGSHVYVYGHGRQNEPRRLEAA
ncbi:MAG: polysaccharide biosynthesis tyrosine autokinase [Sphingomicrobium sp.]